MKSLSSHVGEEDVKVSLHQFGSSHLKSCFTTLGVDLSLSRVDRVLHYYKTERECDESGVVTEQAMLEAMGVSSVSQLNTGRAWWNETYMSDDSLDALQYLANYQTAYGRENTNRISIIVTPKLPTYSTAPNNDRQSLPDGSTFIPSKGTHADDCDERNHPDYRVTASAMMTAQILPVVLTSYNDPVMNGLDTMLGWTSVLRAMGYQSHSKVALVNPYGDLFYSKLYQSVKDLCSTTNGLTPSMAVNSSVTSSTTEETYTSSSSATSTTAIITYAITGIGGLGLLALAVVKIKQKLSAPIDSLPSQSPDHLPTPPPPTLDIFEIPEEDF